MLLTQDADVVESSGLGEAQQFSIAASPKAFEILSSNLYQNKVLAVIREITCNAVDAHTLVGKPISAIYVHLPTFDEPYFEVRDYGLGLAHADVMELYTTYFRSTKDQSNELIGGFGLGSKSPFAVADQFSVTSWHGGTKSEYICYKEGGLPRVNHIRTVPSSESCGLTVRVAAPNIMRWLDEAATLFRWWPERPTLNRDLQCDSVFAPDNVLCKSDVYLNGLPSWAQLRSGSPTVMMGLVPYRLDLDLIQNHLPQEIRSLFSRMNLFLNLPVGTLEISPSRETLSYDPVTIQLLVDMLTKLAKKMMTDLLDSLKACPSLYEARRFVYGSGRYTSGLIGALQNLAEKDTVKWRGQRIPRNVLYEYKKTTPTQGYACYVKDSHRKTVQRIYHDDPNVLFRLSTDSTDCQHVVWTAKLTPKAKAKAVYHLIGDDLEHRPTYISRHVIHIFSGTPYEDLAKQLAELGVEPPTNLDELDDVPSEKVASVSRPTTKGYILTIKPDATVFSWEPTKNAIDLRGGGVYLPCKEGGAVAVLRNVFAAFTQLTRSDIMKNFPGRVIAIPASRLTSAKLRKELAANGWVELTADWLRSKIDPSLLAYYYERHIFHNYLNDKVWQGAQRALWQRGLGAYSSDAPWPGADPFFKCLKGLVDNHGWSTSGPYFRLAKEFAVEVFTSAQVTAIYNDADVKIASLDATYKDFLDKHPMLKHVAPHNLPEEVFLEYINR